MHSVKSLQAFHSNFYKSTLRNKLLFHCFLFQYLYLIILINSTSYMGKFNLALEKNSLQSDPGS